MKIVFIGAAAVAVLLGGCAGKDKTAEEEAGVYIPPPVTTGSHIAGVTTSATTGPTSGVQSYRGATPGGGG